MGRHHADAFSGHQCRQHFIARGDNHICTDERIRFSSCDARGIQLVSILSHFHMRQHGPVFLREPGDI